MLPNAPTTDSSVLLPPRSPSASSGALLQWLAEDNARGLFQAERARQHHERPGTLHQRKVVKTDLHTMPALIAMTSCLPATVQSLPLGSAADLGISSFATLTSGGPGSGSFGSDEWGTAPYQSFLLGPLSTGTGEETERDEELEQYLMATDKNHQYQHQHRYHHHDEVQRWQHHGRGAVGVNGKSGAWVAGAHFNLVYLAITYRDIYAK